MDRQFKALLYEPMHQEGTMLLEEKCNVIYAKSYDEDTILILHMQTPRVWLSILLPWPSCLPKSYEWQIWPFGRVTGKRAMSS